MKKTRVKSKSKTRNKKTKNERTLEIVINGQLDSLTDHLKQLLAACSLEIDKLNLKLAKTLTDYPVDRLAKNLARVLLHNPCFVEKDGKWTVDKRGQETNDPVYQWLSTVAHPLNFHELKKIAAENSFQLGQEKDLVWDSRFIRLKNGKWALSTWRVLTKVSSSLISAILECITKNGQPLSLLMLQKELGGQVSAELLQQAVKEDGRLIEVCPGMVYSAELYNKMIAGLTTADPLEVFRQAEINVLQEAELMLIIKDNQPNKRQYILSSDDLEKGKLTLTRRLEKIFRDFPAECYLNFQLSGKNTGIWYLRELHVLVGFAGWFKANGLEPGHILELSWTVGDLLPTFTLDFTGEREAEVYSEGVRVQKLARICQTAGKEQLDLERALILVMELYPQGLRVTDLEAALKAMGISSTNLEPVLRAYPFFEELEGDVWRCNPAMKDRYFQFLEQIKKAQQELEKARQEAAGSLAEARILQQEKESLQDELVYLQNHYREEQALYQQKLSELAMQNEHWHLENARLKAELGKMQQREEQLIQEMEVQSQQLVNLRQEKNKLKVKNEQLENKMLQLQSSLNRTIEEAEAEIVRLKKQLQEKVSQLDSMQYANQELQRNLARLHEERRDMKRKLSFWPVRLVISLFALGSRKSAG